MKVGRGFPALVLLLSCGEPGLPEPEPAPVQFSFAVAGVEGLPRFGTTPFPDDQFQDPDGTLALIPGVEALVGANGQVFASALDDARGFGVTQAVYLFTDGALDPRSLPASSGDSLVEGASAFLVEVAPVPGQRIPVEVKFLPEHQALALLPRPGVTLKEGATYLAAATDAIRPLEEGAALVPNALFARLTTADPSTLAGAEAEGAARLQGALAAVGLDPSGLRAAAVFTTGLPNRELDNAAAIVRATPPRVSVDPGDPAVAPFALASFAKTFDPQEASNPPSLRATLDDLLGSPQDDPDGVDFPGLDNPGGLAHDAIGLVITGALLSPNFQRPELNTDAPDDDTFLVVDGVPQVIEAERPIPVTLILPDPAVSPMPPAGYPVVIATHGLNNSRRFLFAFANHFARRGIAVVGIDIIHHGSRFDPTDEENNFFRNGAYNGPDGLGDNEGLGLDQPATRLFELFLNLPAVRDNLRQSALDLLALSVALSEGIDLSSFAPVYGASIPRLDGSQQAYLGNSMGTIVGSLFLGIAPEVRVAALNVPGSGLANNIVANSPNVGGQLFSLALLGFFGGASFSDPLDRFHPLLNLVQIALDPADPQAVAPRLLDRQLLLLEVLDDETVPNQSTEGMARGFGVELLGPLGENAARPVADLGQFDAAGVASANQRGLTRLLVQVAPATHSDNLERRSGTRNFVPGGPFDDQDPRFVRLEEAFSITQPIREVQGTLGRFFASGFAGGPAEVEVLAPPRLDFDGDGFCDAEEETAGDPLDPSSTPPGRGSCFF